MVPHIYIYVSFFLFLLVDVRHLLQLHTQQCKTPSDPHDKESISVRKLLTLEWIGKRVVVGGSESVFFIRRGFIVYT